MPCTPDLLRFHYPINQFSKLKFQIPLFPKLATSIVALDTENKRTSGVWFVCETGDLEEERRRIEPHVATHKWRFGSASERGSAAPDLQV